MGVSEDAWWCVGGVLGRLKVLFLVLGRNAWGEDVGVGVGVREGVC